MTTDIDQHTPVAPQTTIPVVTGAGPVHAVVTGLTPEASEQLREHLATAAGGGSRFVWFLTGFVAAIAAVAAAGLVFLAVSDSDDDGSVRLDVPAVDVNVDG